MDIKDIHKGLVVYQDRLGLLVVDRILEDRRISCAEGHVIT